MLPQHAANPQSPRRIGVGIDTSRYFHYAVFLKEDLQRIVRRYLSSDPLKLSEIAVKPFSHRGLQPEWAVLESGDVTAKAALTKKMLHMLAQ